MKKTEIMKKILLLCVNAFLPIALLAQKGRGHQGGVYGNGHGNKHDKIIIQYLLMLCYQHSGNIMPLQLQGGQSFFASNVESVGLLRAIMKNHV